MFVTRFAPSPSGWLHLGHAYSAAIGQHQAQISGGKFHLRIEDLDQTRCRLEFVEAIFEDLKWLGLSWDEPLIVQSDRTSNYLRALEMLRDRGLVFACFCTRSDIAQALSAPHGEVTNHYPGTCRGLPDDPERRANTPHCWRLDGEKALMLTGKPSWREIEGQCFSGDLPLIGYPILARKDAPASYHLACVVDDAASGVTLVVRGSDLRSSTPVQRVLQILLGLPEPLYLHHKLVAHENGRRLSKRDLAPTLRALRDEVEGRALAARLLDGELPLGFRFFES